jgi:predicted DNA-binding transcriptional regulator AlpA
MPDTTCTIEPALLTIPDVCKMLNISRAGFYNLNTSGKFAPLQMNLCRKVLYSKTEIQSWIQAGCPHRKQWLTMKRTSIERV